MQQAWDKGCGVAYRKYFPGRYRDAVVVEYHGFSHTVDEKAIEAAWQSWLGRVAARTRGRGVTRNSPCIGHRGAGKPEFRHVIG
ncbi:hypothetical protein NGB36_30400 [Streptomyces sp. RB6PN25]|uniref:Uncharacterized protein n=1 Tax=Streptomyces humicola TaxID=2953240 RepID=A0ABT1Q4A8_9ACTN|nr:hypothetical protein [Streptomyces humicola]MCQ4084768.1 hypothetical protein [Streptomyces humicola]